MWDSRSSNIFPHQSHLPFSAYWTEGCSTLIWSTISGLSLNCKPHILQMVCVSKLCIWECLFKAADLLNDSPHILHLYAPSVLWLSDVWIFRVALLEKALSHCSHLNDFTFKLEHICCSNSFPLTYEIEQVMHCFLWSLCPLKCLSNDFIVATLKSQYLHLNSFLFGQRYLQWRSFSFSFANLASHCAHWIFPLKKKA